MFPRLEAGVSTRTAERRSVSARAASRVSNRSSPKVSTNATRPTSGSMTSSNAFAAGTRPPMRITSAWGIVPAAGISRSSAPFTRATPSQTADVGRALDHRRDGRMNSARAEAHELPALRRDTAPRRLGGNPARLAHQAQDGRLQPAEIVVGSCNFQNGLGRPENRSHPERLGRPQGTLRVSAGFPPDP